MKPQAKSQQAKKPEAKSPQAKKTYIGVNHGPCDEAKKYADELKLETWFNLEFYQADEFDDHPADDHPAIEADYCFMINVLHEIPYRELSRHLYSILSKIRPGGKLLIHDMCELREPESEFVTWTWDDEPDFRILFDEDHFDMIFLPHQTKSSLPLFTLLVTRKKDDVSLKGISLEEIRSRVRVIYNHKKDRVKEHIEQLAAKKDFSPKRAKEYLYYQKLYFNITKQFD